MANMRKLLCILGLGVGAYLCTGCALTPYIPLEPGAEGAIVYTMPEGESQIERGRPVAFVDGLGHYVISLPSKLLLLNWKVDNHDISEETEMAIKKYLLLNNMPNVKVRLNQYAPGGEWKRLFKNKSVPAIWRYTFGLISCVYYTILPGRVFGGDHYNPYTNTINIYSDLKPVVLHEAAHAKDFARRSRGFRGPYSVLRYFPLVTLYQEALATGDAIGYLRHTQNPDGEKNSYKVLYPAYGSYMGSTYLSFANPVAWAQYAVLYGTAWTMNGVGRIKAATVDESKGPNLGEPREIQSSLEK